METPLERFAAAVKNKGLNIRRSGSGYSVQCPRGENHNHSDRNPSLDAWEKNGQFFFKCHVCGNDKEVKKDILDRLGLTWSELLGNSKKEPQTILPNNEGITLRQYADAKQLDISFLQSVGVQDFLYIKQPAILIPYYDLSGKEVSRQYRMRLDKPKEGGDDRFQFRKGDKTLLYGLWRLNKNDKDAIAIVEGASDCHTLWQSGIGALGVPGASNWNDERDAKHFERFEKVYVFIENDAGGNTLLENITKSQIREKVQLVQLGKYKDVNEMYCDDPKQFKKRLSEAIRQSVSWKEKDLLEKRREGMLALESCKSLASDPALYENLKKEIGKIGYAGDTTPVLFAYLAFTSRLTERPMNLAFVAQSSSGKSYAVETARKFFPETAYSWFDSSSPLALVYTDEQFAHKTIVFAEADSLPEDGSAASALRAIVTDGSLSHEVTERDEETGKFTTRKIVKEGPTGLITTSTRKIREQLSTRMITVTIPDDRKQTKGVLLAIARSANATDGETEPDAKYVDFQRWLELAGNTKVFIPFAEELAEKVPVTQVRMRRDFKQLLIAIKTVAILMQQQRTTDQDGRIIATCRDYEIAKDIIGATFSDVAVGRVPKHIVETVEKVEELCEIPGKKEQGITVNELSIELNIGRDSARNRVKMAISEGFLENLSKGRAIKVIPGDPIPDAKDALINPMDIKTCQGWGGGCLYHSDSRHPTSQNPFPLSEDNNKEPDAQNDQPEKLQNIALKHGKERVGGLTTPNRRDIPTPPAESKKLAGLVDDADLQNPDKAKKTCENGKLHDFGGQFGPDMCSTCGEARVMIDVLEVFHEQRITEGGAL